MTANIVQSGRFTTGGTLEIFPTEAGVLVSDASTNYTDASTGLSVSEFAAGSIGQIFISEESNLWRCSMFYGTYDLTGIIGDAVTAKFQVHVPEDLTDTNFDCDVLEANYGATLTTGDWLDSTSLSALTLLATGNTAGFSLNQYNDLLDGGSVLLPLINASSQLQVIIASRRQIDFIEPSGYEIFSFNGGNLPKLVVTT